MSLSAKSLRSKLALLKPVITGCSLRTIRIGQNKIGELMEARFKEQVTIKEHKFDDFVGAWVMPKEERRQGVILYLHGGGYTCGDIDYATGFGAALAIESGARVFCAAYRLAPENKFPAATDDALSAYKYLLDKGYDPSRILLCGESAGGGLCYSLCFKIRELSLAMPCGIIAISPWADLNMTGRSYDENKSRDPSMTKELLEFFADSYTDDRQNPLASPILGDMKDIPPSLIFAGGDEIMLSDAEDLHRKLSDSGCESKLVVAKERWHAYLLYMLEEDRKDRIIISRFLDRVMSRQNKLMWLRLDNAAKIYPAARRQHWSNVFRLSATLTEEVDTGVLKSALDITVRRFPSIAVRLRRGTFWYYLQQLSEPPEILEESSYPLMHMTREETRKCAIRVIVYKKRIAVEMFHSLTDGNGSLIFLKTLVAEYLTQKYGIYIPAENGVLGRLEEPTPEELEDSFLKHAGNINAGRSEKTAYRLKGTPERVGYLNLTCFTLKTDDVLKAAHDHGITLTAFLCSALMMAIQNLQKEKVADTLKHKPIKVLIPVNLRPIFKSKTMRNFAMYVTPEILPRLGEYSFDEIASAVTHLMGLEINSKQMSMKIATNVKSEQMGIVRIMPLFIKNFIMKAVFDSVGERKSCLTLSNLGRVTLPDAMMPYVTRMDFILGTQASAPHNCGVLSFKDTLYINFVRNIRESDLEYHFFKVLRDMGLSAEVQSNKGENNVLY